MSFDSDGGMQEFAEETGRGSATYGDPSMFPMREVKSVRAEGFIRSKTNNCFPEIKDQPYEKLKEDIRLNGQLNPILVHGNQVLDGWTRCRICRDLGIEVLALEVTHWEEIRATLSSQFNRKHFSKLQKAAIIRDAVETMGRGRPKKESESDHFLDELAEEYGVSKTYLKLVERVKREKSDWVEGIKSGKITYGRVEGYFNKKTLPGQAAKSKTSKAAPETASPTVASETQPDQAEKPEALDTPPEPASTAETMVDQDAKPVSIPEAIEVLKLFRRILARLSKEEDKIVFKAATEPACDFLGINLN